MTLEELATQLTNEAMASGQITVDDQLLGRQDIDSLLSAQLGRPNILLNVPRQVISVQSDPSPYVAVTGTIPLDPADSFLNLEGYAATIVFKQYDQVTGFLMDITLSNDAPQAPAWTFPVSYPALSGTGAELLPATKQHFLFASDAFPSWPAAGLNYKAEVSLTGPYVFFVPVRSLLITDPSKTTLTMAGPITPQLDCLQLRAATQANSNTQDLTLFTATHFQLLFEIDTIGDPDNPGDIIPSASFGCSMDMVVPDSTLEGLKATALLSPTAARNIVQLVVAPVNDDLLSIGDLGRLMNGASWDSMFTGTFGTGLAACFDSFGMISWGAGLTITPVASFSNTVLTIGCDPSQRYVIVEDEIVLERLVMQWMVLDPTNNGPQSFSLDSILRLGDDILFRVQVGFGASALTVQGQLQGELPVNPADWCNALLLAFGYTDGLPSAIADFFGDGFVLTDIVVALVQTSANTDFNISIVGEVPLTTEPTSFEVNMDFVYTTEGWTVRFACTVAVGPATFYGSLVVSNAPGAASNDWQLQVGWENQANPLEFYEIAYGLGFELPPIPPTLDLSLVSASMQYDSGLKQLRITAASTNWGKAVLLAFAQPATPGTPATWVFTFTLAISKTVQTGLQPLINLSNLPLINMQLSNADTLGVDAKVLVTSAPISQTLAAVLNDSIPPGYPLFPVDGFKGTVGFALTLDFGGLILPISLGLEGSTDTSLISMGPQSTIGTPPANSTAPPVATPLPPTSDGTIWVNVQKSFGPVLIAQVGVRFENELLWFLVNADLRLAGLSMSMMGLRAGTPLDTFAPQFDIDGLGIDYKTAGFEFGGALLNMRPATDFLYAGTAVLHVGGVSASVTGSYGVVTGPSGKVTTMFLFGQVKGLSLGNPCFLVTAIAAGVGYNSRLRVPSVTEVGLFPFVTSLSSTATPSTPMAMLTTLMRGSGGRPAWVTAAPGQFWVAAGLSFSSFGFLAVNALAVVEFGDALEVALLGQATAQFPKTGTALSRIQLNLSASYRAAEGALLIAAILTDGSYVLSSAAKLTGGFAFGSWFKGAHAGDFVLTIGGYHPRFSVPAWYPQVPRVGLNWTIGSSVSLVGGAYLAMTPAAMMVGGSLALNYTSGNLRAWFTATFDALIKFVPLAFDLSVGVTVGASYTADTWLGTKTFKVELGANLAMWGPPTGGKVNVEWWVISFTINFGTARASNNAANRKATWDEFTQVLPPAPQCIAISADTGLLGSAPQTAAKAQWLVGGDGLSVGIASAVPLNAAAITLSTSAARTVATSSLVNILPMGLTGLQSKLQVTLTWQATPTAAWVNVGLDNWTCVATPRNVPKALWGVGAGNTLPTGVQLVPSQLVGLQLTAPAPLRGPATGVVPLANLMEAAAGAEMAFPINGSGSGIAPAPSTDATAVHTIITDLNDPTTIQTRQRNRTDLQGLGFVLDVSSATGTTVDYSIERYFDAEPLILLPTSHA